MTTTEPKKSNAGRKPLPPEQRITPKPVYLKALQWAALEEQAKDANKTVSELIIKRFNLS